MTAFPGTILGLQYYNKFSMTMIGSKHYISEYDIHGKTHTHNLRTQFLLKSKTVYILYRVFAEMKTILWKPCAHSEHAASAFTLCQNSVSTHTQTYTHT